MPLPREGGHVAPEFGAPMTYDQATRDAAMWKGRHKLNATVVLLEGWEELLAKKGAR